MQSNGERLLKFTKKSLPVNDLCIYSNGKVTELHFDIIISTGSKKETTKIRDEIIKNQEIVARLNHRVKNAHVQMRNVDNTLYAHHRDSPGAVGILNLASSTMDKVNSTLQELKIYSAILRKDVRNEV